MRVAHAKDAKDAKEGKDGLRREGSTGMMPPLLGYGGAARMWESFFNKRGVRSGFSVMVCFTRS